MNSLVCGEGVYERGTYKCTINCVKTKEYRLWVGMIIRCYSTKARKRRDNYSMCTVSDNFKNFQFFAGWCNQQVGFNCEGFHLDKDVVCKHNKQYHEDLCVFLPHQINTCLTQRKLLRGEYPIGVSYHKPLQKFRAQILEDQVKRHLGYFEDSCDAFHAYKSAKESQVKIMAERFRDKISEKAYRSLLDWKVDFTD